MPAAEFLEANWPYALAIAALATALAVYLLLANRKTSVITDRRDVLDEGAERAQRNQALIDSAPAATRQPEQSASFAQSSEADDLTRIKGLGPRIAGMLGDLGVTSYAQIAAWDDFEIDRIDAALGRFEGRIRRDGWVEQAKLLNAGDESGFVAKFGQDG